MKEAIKISPAQMKDSVMLCVLAQSFLQYKSSLGKYLKREHFAVRITGVPGIAKSATLKGLPAVLETVTGQPWGYAGVNLANTMPEEFKGLPVVNRENHTTENYPMSELVVKGEFGLYVMEEFDRPLVPSTQAAAAKLIQRELGADQIPINWTIILTGNGASDGLQDPDHHIINRCCNLYIDANGEAAERSFIQFAEREDFDASVVLMPQLHPIETFADWVDISECTYRTKMYASAVIKAWRKYSKMLVPVGFDLDGVLLAVLCGLVGVVHGRELHALVLRDTTLPTFGQVVNSPDTVTVCTEIDKATPFLDSLVRLCASEHDAIQVMQYIVRHHAEVARCALQKLVAHKLETIREAVKVHPTYRDFIAND